MNEYAQFAACGACTPVYAGPETPELLGQLARAMRSWE